MSFRNRVTPVLLLLSMPLVSAPAAETPLPDALAAPGETVVLTAHAEGMQIYECKAGTDGKLAWAFREPVATLIAGDKIVGRPPGATAKDIAWLKLDVVSRRGSGLLSNVTTVQRINTVGGKLDDACDRPGDNRSMPYTADYVFLRKG